MIQLLFTLLAAEAALVLVLLFRTPARRLALLALDRAKRGRGPVMVRTVAATMIVVLGSSGYSIAKIRRRVGDLGQLTPTDQVLASRHLLEASLMGYSLFLGIIIDRLHHYIRELRTMKKNMEAVTKQSRVLEEAKHGSVEGIQQYQKEISSLNEQVQELKRLSEKKTEELKTAEANALALQKQSEGLLTEYERLIAENEQFRSQLQSMDLRMSHSDGKKNT
ncbi:B-cell receptor-associated protein 31-like [Oryza brachyantha]|uniref:Endoplasmic reticulum transmembrane protein n=1 Tax=Oryza brachyantha TaxID=4533 RepID=J3M5F0_ORYBR|nr:B-cell receptor-associated protein 31-like [Oryza brachyantha]